MINEILGRLNLKRQMLLLVSIYSLGLIGLIVYQSSFVSDTIPSVRQHRRRTDIIDDSTGDLYGYACRQARDDDRRRFTCAGRRRID